MDDALPRTAHLPFDEQVAALAAILDEDGYLADAERLDDGSWRITEHNCAILTVAHGFSQACTSELAFVRDALPAPPSPRRPPDRRRARVRLRGQPAGAVESAGLISITDAPSTSWISVRNSSMR